MVEQQSRLAVGQFPHCDQRILHAPGECKYCDWAPEWQALRQAWGVAFTGSEQSLRLLANPEVQPCTRPYPHLCEVETAGPCNGWPRTWPTVPCPADAARPPTADNDHRRWGGNRPTSAMGDPSWPAESAASRMMYGDFGGRARPVTPAMASAVSRILSAIKSGRLW